MLVLIGGDQIGESLVELAADDGELIDSFLGEHSVGLDIPEDAVAHVEGGDQAVQPQYLRGNLVVLRSELEVAQEGEVLPSEFAH